MSGSRLKRTNLPPVKQNRLVVAKALNLNFSERITMKRTIALLAAIACLSVCSAVHADYSVWDKGMWPESWPKELEPLRKQARTYEGPRVLYRIYPIPFTNREDF